MRSRLFDLEAIVALVTLTQGVGLSQTPFVNLDFEHPIPPLVQDPFGMAPIANALPGWSGYYNGNPTDHVFYNAASIGAAAVSLHGAGSIFLPLAGSYSAGVSASRGGVPTTAAIGQVGQVPFGTKSLLFYVSPSSIIDVTFAGQPVTLVQLSSTSTFEVWGGDISAFAGQTGELRFIAPLGGGAFLDNIQFSPVPVPEPGALSLLAGVALWVACSRRRGRRGGTPRAARSRAASSGTNVPW